MNQDQSRHDLEISEELQEMMLLADEYGLNENDKVRCRKLRRDSPDGIFLYQNDLLFAASEFDVTLPLYKRHEWELLDESSGPGLCGIVALKLSLQAQYPNDRGVASLRFNDLLSAVENPDQAPELLNMLETRDFEDLQLAAGLHKLSNGRNRKLFKNYKLVVCHQLDSLGHIARRTIWNPKENGDNLYIYLEKSDLHESYNHWKGMKKRIEPEPLPKPEPVSRSKQQQSRSRGPGNPSHPLPPWHPFTHHWD